MDERIGSSHKPHHVPPLGNLRASDRNRTMPGVDDARRHLLFLVEGEVADVVQALRARWDPVMTARIPPHVSLVYPEEVTDERLLLERATTHTATTDASRPR